jgi:glycerol-3-phosphate acyltransferase PlsY
MNPDLAPAVLLMIIVVGYFLGSIPFGLLLTRLAGLGDIRRIGSGNIGATNVLRTGRKGLALATLLLDAAKGATAVLFGGVELGLPGILCGGLAAVVGHLFPVWLRFRGGKGVATGLGVLIAASPTVGLLACAVWAATAYFSRMSSASALAAFVAAPVVAAVTVRPLEVSALALIAAVLVIWRHKDNIRRLIAGTEPRIGEKH